jgi:hypothetical protein
MIVVEKLSPLNRLNPLPELNVLSIDPLEFNFTICRFVCPLYSKKAPTTSILPSSISPEYVAPLNPVPLLNVLSMK